MILNINNMPYQMAENKPLEFDMAEKTANSIKLYKKGVSVLEITNITSMGIYTLVGGTWTAEKPTTDERLTAAESAVLALMGVPNV
ncbi:MAG: hypothetical protein RR087_09800 [Oscillospiraceae bacterium]